MHLNTIKAVYNNSTSNILLNGEKLKDFPLKSGKIQGCTTTSIQHSIGIPSHSIQTRKRKQRHPNHKELILLLFADYRIL